MIFTERGRNHRRRVSKIVSSIMIVSFLFDPLAGLCGLLDGLFLSNGGALSLKGLAFAEGGLLALNPGCRLAKLREPSDTTFCEWLWRHLRYEG